jgi:transcriptional regulator with XRE-family HTH domain
MLSTHQVNQVNQVIPTNPITQLRLTNNLTQRKLARLLGVSIYYINNLELGFPTSRAVAALLDKHSNVLTDCTTINGNRYNIVINSELFMSSYTKFQEYRRSLLKPKIAEYENRYFKNGFTPDSEYNYAGPGAVAGINRWIVWRENEFGTMRAFCSYLCLNPAIVDTFEKKDRIGITSVTIREAMIIGIGTKALVDFEGLVFHG